MTVFEIRRQVAIVGQVTDGQTKRALAGAQVSFTKAAGALVDRLVTVAKGVKITDPAVAAAQATLNNVGASNEERLNAAQSILDFLQARRLLSSRRPDLTHAAADGIFFFTDLPPGDYMLTATLTGAGTRYGVGQTAATVTANNGDIVRVIADIAVPSTALRGRITGPSLDGDDSVGPVPMAIIEVRGSGERTYSDAAGDYLLPGVETGQRTVTVTARGYQRHEQMVTFTSPGSEQIVNVTLALPP